MNIPNRFGKLAFLVQLIVVGLTGTAFAQADFYKGKTIKIIRGGGPVVRASSRPECWCDFWKSTFRENPL